ncbi:hypothetical protein [Brevundimonas sp.]|uniref:hypothetical protein n=1 Tax=Brevundimonas sp. TaxID=1871086 RepID=UPI0035686053
MTRMSSSDATLLQAAASEAISAAWWDRLDLEARRPGEANTDLILGKAAELAFSPIARDQLMSLALVTGVRDTGGTKVLVETSVPSAERAVIAERVLRQGPHKASETDALVAEIEERNTRDLDHDARFDLLPQRIRQDAALQELLWDHPAIPARDDVRLAMLCSIPKLFERVETLSGGLPWRLVTPWLNRITGRGA